MNRTTIDPHADDAALHQYYESLRIPEPLQRAAALKHWEESRQLNALPVMRSPRLRSMAIALAVLIMAAASLMWEFQTQRVALGAEGLPERLAKVENFRMSGWHYIPTPDGNSDTKLAVEFVVKRPGKFRHTTSSIEESGERQTIKTGLRLCDGQQMTMVQLSEKSYAQGPIDPLEAVLETEAFAQLMVLAMVLGPPDMNFQRQGSEEVRGVPCDLYTGSFHENNSIRLWVNPKTGWPERVLHENVDQAGKRTKTLEMTEIIVNGDLPDSVFAFTPPAGYTDLAAVYRAANPGTPPGPPLEIPAAEKRLAITPHETSSAHGGNHSLFVWNGFRLTDDTALIVWKRTAPTAEQDGSLDWLQGIDWKFRNAKEPRGLKHQWVHPPQPDQWLWSLVKTTDGRPFDVGVILMQFHGVGFKSTLDIIPLQSSDPQLDQIIREAAKSISPMPTPEITLESLRGEAARF